jgi:adenylate cyclase
LDRAYAAAQKAVELDPNSQRGHFALANVYFFRKEKDRFFVEAERALALNPNNTEVIAALGVRIAYLGQWERGVALMRKAMALNPSHPGWYWFPIVYDYYGRGDYEKALEAALRVDMPDYFYTHVALALCYVKLGRQNLASAAVQEIRRTNSAFEKNPARYIGMWRTEDVTQQVVQDLYKAGLPRAAEK